MLENDFTLSPRFLGFAKTVGMIATEEKKQNKLSTTSKNEKYQW
jgi:hypothetical protein